MLTENRVNQGQFYSIKSKIGKSNFKSPLFVTFWRKSTIFLWIFINIMNHNLHLSSYRLIIFKKYFLACNFSQFEQKFNNSEFCHVKFGWRTFQPRTFQPQASTPDLSTPEFSTMNFSTPKQKRTFQPQTFQPWIFKPWTF